MKPKTFVWAIIGTLIIVLFVTGNKAAPHRIWKEVTSPPPANFQGKIFQFNQPMALENGEIYPAPNDKLLPFTPLGADERLTVVNRIDYVRGCSSDFLTFYCHDFLDDTYREPVYLLKDQRGETFLIYEGFVNRSDTHFTT